MIMANLSRNLLSTDEFLQCRNCGQMYHKQTLKVEAKLGDFVETSDNPHDDKKSEITTLYSRGRGATTKRLKQKEETRTVRQHKR